MHAVFSSIIKSVLQSQLYYAEFGHTSWRRFRNQPTLSRLHFLFVQNVDWWSINSEQRACTNHAAAVLPIIPLCLRRFINYSTSIIQSGTMQQLCSQKTRPAQFIDTDRCWSNTWETLLLYVSANLSVTQPAGTIIFCSFPRPIFVSLHASLKLSNFTGAHRDVHREKRPIVVQWLLHDYVWSWIIHFARNAPAPQGKPVLVLIISELTGRLQITEFRPELKETSKSYFHFRLRSL